MNKYLPLSAAALCISLSTAGATTITDGLTVSGTNPSLYTATINGDFQVATPKINLWTEMGMFNIWSGGPNYSAQAEFFVNESAAPENVSAFTVRTWDNSWTNFSAVTLSTGWNNVAGHHAVIAIQEPVTQAYTTYLDGRNLSFYKYGAVFGRQKPSGSTPARVDTMVVAQEELANGSAAPAGSNAMRVTKKGQILIIPQGDISMGTFTSGSTP